MAGASALDEEEERIRLLVRDLDDERRRAYYRRLNPRLRDPDTYVALNYLAPIGLHHFYLGHWAAGLVDLGMFGVGAAFLFTDWPSAGLVLMGVVTLRELVNLFWSQSIVKRFNNEVSAATLEEITE